MSSKFPSPSDAAAADASAIARAEARLDDACRAVDPWPTLRRGPAHDHRVFTVESVVRRSPRTGREGDYHVIRSAPWVNVVAITPDDALVLVAQYRHGTETVTLEIPGGMVDPDEPPAVAAARELREETGYAGDDPIALGLVHPNPAIQDNACTTWLIENARPVAEQEPDEGEDLRVVTVPMASVPALVARGHITHALVLCAFYWLDRHRARVAEAQR
ncbi:MAG: NUDIX hydrolase [Acidobacteriota bacterium]